MLLGDLDCGFAPLRSGVRNAAHRSGQDRWERLGASNGASGQRRGSTSPLCRRVGLAELDPELFTEAMQDRPALKAALRALVLLAGVWLVSCEEADLDQNREGAAHAGLGQPKSLVLGQGPPVDREGAQEPPGAPPSPEVPTSGLTEPTL